MIKICEFEKDIRVVKWKDHFTRARWHEPAAVIKEYKTEEPLIVTTIGYYMGEDENYVYLSNGVTNHPIPDALATHGILWADIVSHEKICT